MSAAQMPVATRPLHAQQAGAREARVRDGGAADEGAFEDLLERVESREPASADHGGASETAKAHKAPLEIKSKVESGRDREVPDAAEQQGATAQTAASTQMALSLASFLIPRQAVNDGTGEAAPHIELPMAAGSPAATLEPGTAPAMPTDENVLIDEDLLAAFAKLGVMAGERAEKVTSAVDRQEAPSDFKLNEDAGVAQSLIDGMKLTVGREETHLAIVKQALPDSVELMLRAGVSADALAAATGEQPTLRPAAGKIAGAIVEQSESEMELPSGVQEAAALVSLQPDGEASVGSFSSSFGQSGFASPEQRETAAPEVEARMPDTDQVASGGAQLAKPQLPDAVAAAELTSFDALVEASPATQIVSRVTTELGSGVQDGAVRVLHIELKPENLGSVTVRVSLKNDVVSVDLSAQRPETAAQIERERDALASALKQAGYVVDTITAQHSDTRAFGRVDQVQSGSSASLGSASSDRQLAGQSAEQGQSGQRQHSERDGEAGRQDRGSRSALANEARGGLSRSGSGALYV